MRTLLLASRNLLKSSPTVLAKAALPAQMAALLIESVLDFTTEMEVDTFSVQTAAARMSAVVTGRRSSSSNLGRRATTVARYWAVCNEGWKESERE